MPVGPWQRVVDRDAVAERAPEVVVVDSRTAERYRGEEEPIDPVAGHIPGAVSAPHPGNLTEDLTLLPAGDLRARFIEIGATDPDNVIVYCGSGVTSCHNILAMELAGIGRPWLYEGSWSDWCTSDMPIATRPTP
jgi:thiosulfate/3-mercaptopyruvate sulfurtransferase